jgi:zinc protease
VPPTASLATAVTPREGTTRLSEPDRVSVPKVIETWRGPPPFAEGDLALSVVAQILAGGKSSRLYRRLVFDDRLASEVDAGWNPHVLGGRFTVEAIAQAGVSAEAVEQALDEELARMRANPPTAGEVLRARRVLEAELLRGMENLVWRAERLAEYDAYLGTPDHLEAELAALAAITPEAIQQAVVTWLGVDARVIATVVPQAAATKEAAP